MGYQRRVHGESISLHQSSENSRSKMSQIARIAISNCNRSVLAGWQRPVVAMSQQTSRALTTTTVNKDIDSAAKFIGYARNPSLKQQLFSYAILGFALFRSHGSFLSYDGLPAFVRFLNIGCRNKLSR